jgi:hypothetical protein
MIIHQYTQSLCVCSAVTNDTFILPYVEHHRCYIFDALHGVINVVKILVSIVKDIQQQNSDKVGEQLVTIMKDILPQLSVPGKDEAEFSVDALNGDDSVIFLNRFDEIATRLLGVTEEELRDDEEQREEEARCVELLWGALTKLRATDLEVDKALTVYEKRGTSDDADEADAGEPAVAVETDAEILAREQGVESEGPDAMAAAMAAAGGLLMTEAGEVHEDEVLQPSTVQRRIARRAALRMLLEMQATLGDALACMMCRNVDKAPKCVRGRRRGNKDSHDDLIDCYDDSIHAFVQVTLSSCA